MRYILLNNGYGIFRRDATKVKTKSLEFLFEGAPGNCEVRFKSKGKTTYMPLSNGVITFDVSEIRGTLEVTVVSSNQRWKCDSLYIGESKNGDLFIATEACYGEKIASLWKEHEALKKEVRHLKQMLVEAKEEYKIKKTYNEII